MILATVPYDFTGNGGFNVNMEYTVLAKAYTSICLVGEKIERSNCGESSSGALNIQPDGRGHGPLYLILDNRAFIPTSVMHGLPSSVIITFEGKMLPCTFPMAWIYPMAFAICFTIFNLSMAIL